MFTKISVLIPTRHRVGRLETLLASYARTICGSSDTELVFRVDDDDLETQDYLSSQHLRNGSIHLVVGPRHQGYQSMPRFFNELLAASTGDVLMCGNDDMVFQTVGWPSLILSAANQYPDGVFDFGVSTHNETHYPFSIVSRKVTERLGFLWDPRIFWGDMYLRDVMAIFGRCVMLPAVQIDHDWAGFQPDQVFEESDKDILGKDPTYWTCTHAQAVKDAVERLHALCPLRIETMPGSWAS